MIDECKIMDIYLLIGRGLPGRVTTYTSHRPCGKLFYKDVMMLELPGISGFLKPYISHNVNFDGHMCGLR